MYSIGERRLWLIQLIFSAKSPLGLVIKLVALFKLCLLIIFCFVDLFLYYQGHQFFICQKLNFVLLSSPCKLSTGHSQNTHNMLYEYFIYKTWQDNYHHHHHQQHQILWNWTLNECEEVLQKVCECHSYYLIMMIGGLSYISCCNNLLSLLEMKLSLNEDLPDDTENLDVILC